MDTQIRSKWTITNSATGCKSDFIRHIFTLLAEIRREMDY